MLGIDRTRPTRAMDTIEAGTLLDWKMIGYVGASLTVERPGPCVRTGPPFPVVGVRAGGEQSVGEGRSEPSHRCHVLHRSHRTALSPPGRSHRRSPRCR